MFFQEFPDAVNVQVHVVVQGINPAGAEDREPQDARTSGGKHGPVADHRRAVDDDHGQAGFSRVASHDLCQRQLLVGRCLLIQKNFRHLLPGGTRGGHRLENLVIVDAFQLSLLEKPHRHHGNVIVIPDVFRIIAQPVHDPSVVLTAGPVMLGQFQQSLCHDPGLLPAIHGIGILLQQFCIIHINSPLTVPPAVLPVGKCRLSKETAPRVPDIPACSPAMTGNKALPLSENLPRCRRQTGRPPPGLPAGNLR